MGSACSAGEEARHHRENKKNRSNPTESYDTWQQKMLLDIGADPLAVVRDFPRMIVYVGSETHHNYIPGESGGDGHGLAGQRRGSDNPFAPSGTTSGSHKPGAAAGGGSTYPHGPDAAHHHSHHQHRPSNADQGKSGAEAGRPPQLRDGMRRPSQREPFRDDDAFAARVRRVREEVLLLSELCGERATFGSAFEAAWDRLVSQSATAMGSESEAASEAVAGSLPAHEDHPPASATTRRSTRAAAAVIPLDVHQLLLNACVESGMLAMTEESTTAAAAAAVPPPPNRTSPSSATRPSSALHPSGDTSAATGLLATDTPADYSTHGRHKKEAKGRHSTEKEAAVKSSSNSQIRSMPSVVTPGTPGVTPPSLSRYVVRSATFHLMQFATQGVMFFPVQRLKHVLWVPWASHMQDVSWTIHFTLKDATAADIIALKQQTLNALYNNASTVLDNEAAVEAVDAGLSSPSLQHATAAALAANKTGPQTDQSADVFGAAAGRHGGALADPETRAKRKIIVVQHVQTGRHYVEDAASKTTPRYELDWACSIRVDQRTLQEAFAPYQHFATAPPPPPPQQQQQQAVEDATQPAFSHSSAAEGQEAAPSSHTPLLRHSAPRDGGKGEGGGHGGGEGEAGSTGAEGVTAAQQPELLLHEVVASTVEVVAARVERPPHTLCMVSSTWKKRKEELDYVLEQQYKVNLEETDALHAKRLY